MVILYGIANCDTIRKTRKWLQDHQVDYEFHDYRKAGCDSALVNEFLKHFDHEELINRRGTTWRRLPDSQKENLDSSLAAKLMQENPSLIKRPLLRVNKQWHLGYDTDRFAALLG